MSDTKTKILDAAEHLISDHGLDVSLRSITTEAGVNLAAVNYHFQSKDALIDAVIARRIEPINRARLEMLDSIERDHPCGPLPLERVLDAFLAPVFQLSEGQHVRILTGRFYSQPDEFLKRVFFRHLQPILVRFQAALARAVPDLPAEDRLSCTMFTVGAMVHLMAWSGIVGTITNGAVDAQDVSALTDRMVTFAAGGFRAVNERVEALNQGIRHA